MNKNQFMHILQQNLHDLGQENVTDILADFEEHFANGLSRGRSEEDITAELGDPLEIARQYLDDTEASVTARPVLQTSRYLHPDTPAENPPPVVSQAAASAGSKQKTYASSETAAGSETIPVKNKINETALVAVILINVFLGIPIWIALFSTLFGFWVAAGGIGVAACVLFAAAILKAGIVSLILVLFGLALAALTILAVILMVYLTK